MTDKTLFLPFIAEAHNGKESVSYPTEIACVTCMTELQRKKTGFLRDAPEKVSFLSKIYYPIWAVPLGDSCLIIDGSAFSPHQFTFKEPTNTEPFIEDLKKSSVLHQEFMAALNKQAKKVEKFASAVNMSFRGLIAEREILKFFLECFESSSFLSKDKENTVLIPSDIDEKTVAEAHSAVSNWLRKIQANIKGLQYALQILNEEVEFHARMITNEIELLKEKCEAEVSSLKPEVEKNIEQLKLKREESTARFLKDTEKRAGVFERKREKYLLKLKELEHKKEYIQKQKGSTARKTYALEKSEREINNVKKEIRALCDAIENVKREENKSVKEVEEEFRRAVAQEEEKIKKLTSTYESKISKKKEQITKIANAKASITKSIESLIEEIKREAHVFREQISINYKLDSLTLMCVPIYLIGYAKDSEERYSLLSPTTISEDTSVLQELRKILTFTSEPRLKLLMRPRSTELHEMLSSRVTKRMQSDETFQEKVTKICRANNLLERWDFEKNLNEGLAEAERKGWITAEEADAACKGIRRQET